MKAKPKRNWKRTLIVAAVILLLLCIIGVVLPLVFAESPAGKEALARIETRTAVAAVEMTAAVPSATDTLLPSPTWTASATLTRTASPVPTETATEGPSPTFTRTATNTTTPTRTKAPTNTKIPTRTAIPSKTPLPTRTLTPTPAPTAIPDTAGVTDWIVYEGQMIGVREIVFSKYLGYFRPETGKIFVSLYVVAINQSGEEKSFLESDLALVDGGGEISGSVIFGDKEPEFSSCTLKPGGNCEGWWTTVIWDKPEVKDKLSFRWNPCWVFCSAMEVEIRQK